MNIRDALIVTACVFLPLGGTALAANGAVSSAINRPEPAIQAGQAVQKLIGGLCEAGNGLLAVGEHGDILSTGDAENWTQIPAPVDVLMTRCSFADSQNGWAVGYNATILHTADGGKSWALQNYDAKAGNPLMSVVAIDRQNAVAIGAFDLLLHTSDGGKSWIKAAGDTFGKLGPHLNDIVRLKDGRLVVVGEGGLIAVSADGGATWVNVKSPYGGTLFGAVPLNGSGLVVYGIGGHVFRTDDLSVADPQWVTVKGSEGSSMFGGVNASNSCVVLVGIRGDVVRMTGQSDLSPVSTNLLRRVAAGAGSDAKKVSFQGALGSFTTVARYNNTLVLGGVNGIFTASASQVCGSDASRTGN